MKQKRAWQRMLSGRRLDLLDPTPMDIEIEDIAHGLSFVARWNGQTAPITLAAWSGKRLWTAPSWDKMRFPKPFGRATLIYSDAIILEKTKDKDALEAMRKMLEDRLNALVEACDNAQTGKM